MKHSKLNFVTEWRSASDTEHELVMQKLGKMMNRDSIESIISGFLFALIGLPLAVMMLEKGAYATSRALMIWLCASAMLLSLVSSAFILVFVYKAFKTALEVRCLIDRDYNIAQVEFDNLEMDDVINGEIVPMVTNEDGSENKDFKLVDLCVTDIIACKKGAKGYLVQTMKDIRLMSVE